MQFLYHMEKSMYKIINMDPIYSLLITTVIVLYLLYNFHVRCYSLKVSHGLGLCVALKYLRHRSVSIFVGYSVTSLPPTAVIELDSTGLVREW